MSARLCHPVQEASLQKETSAQSHLICKHRTSQSTQHSTKLSVHTMASRIVLVVLFNILLVSPIYCQENSLQNSTVAEAINGTIIIEQQSTRQTIYTAPKSLNFADCYARVDNGRQAAYICTDKQELLPLLLYAEQEGKEICEKAFKHHHWNCTDFSILKEPKVTRGEVFKESAYVYALSMAVIAHTVTQACALGELESCTCDEGPTTVEEDVTLKHCSDEYGIQVAEKFLRLRDSKKGKDLKDELFDHNIKATKNIIRASVLDASAQCKCHGVSGTCTVKTCYSPLTDIDTIALKIKEKFSSACHVESNGHTVSSWVPKKNGVCSSFTENHLIFRGVYNFCIPNPILGSTGVVGRICEPHTNGPDSCEKVCRQCNKEIVKVMHLVREERDCRFHFCCDITCEVVESQSVYHICA